MNNIKTKSFTSIPKILMANARDEYDLQKHLKDYEEVLREYVQYFTHQQSTALSREDYEKIRKHWTISSCTRIIMQICL